MTAGRWRVGLAATLALTGVGLLYADPTLLGAAVVPLAYVCYGVVSGLSTAPELRATRRFDPDVAGPGERVTVSLRVENVGDSVVPDLRVVDGVPDLAVVEGSPRLATALAPGETARLSYSVVTRRGDHEFDGPLVRSRSLSASSPRTERLGVETGETLTCRTPTRDRLTDSVLGRLGRLSADGRGQGTEFYATREYRRGDPMRRIDWRHVAKTGEFVTVEYRDQQATQTAVVVDVRPSGRVRPVPGHPTGAGLAAEAADRILSGLDRSNSLAGLGVAGLDPGGPLATDGSVAWTDSTGQRTDPGRLLSDVRDTVGTGAPEPDTDARGTRVSVDRSGAVQSAVARPDGGPDGAVECLLGQLPPGAQVVFCTPALDDWAVTLGRAAANRGHGLVVVSPDITAVDAVGPRCVALGRRPRLTTLAQFGEVVDWLPGRRVSFGATGVR